MNRQRRYEHVWRKATQAERDMLLDFTERRDWLSCKSFIRTLDKKYWRVGR